MMHRQLALSVAAIAAVLVLLSPAGAAVQGAADDTWTTPRTPWGDPDLQGIWTTDWERSVPLERPVEFGERADLSAEEIAARAEREAIRLADNKDDRNRRPDDPEAGPEHWYEFGDRTSPRTSLIVDPPDGRIPALTLGAQTRYIDPSSHLGFVGGS